ncbi:MAG TPA: M23 family metallopeptidase [Solirubrobacter sp.]
MFSKRTRIAGLTFSVLWILFFTGQLRPVVRSLLEPAAAHPPRATVPQYLPWTPGRAVRVLQGNNGTFSHQTPENRYAWDFGLRHGEPIFVGLAGVVDRVATGCDVVDSQHCNGGYGNTVSVRALDGTCARFGHLDKVAVVEHQVVALGAFIGTVGSSGRSTGFHLHYQREVCETGIAIPSRFVEAGVPHHDEYVTSGLPLGT